MDTVVAAGLRANALEEARRLAHRLCGPSHQAIFFCNRRTAVEVLTRYLKEAAPHFKLYMTPVNVDPNKPALPISHPFTYAVYLSKTLGRYSTLGLAEDTWALNEGVIDDDTFLKLTYDIDRERKDMFMASLERQRGGTLTCVFDATDRIQHMYWRYAEQGHPAAAGISDPEYKDAIREHYKRNDALLAKLGEISDRHHCEPSSRIQFHACLIRLTPSACSLLQVVLKKRRG